MASNISNMLGAANYSYLFNNSATQKTNSINSLWQNYGSFNQNAANSLGMLQEINQNRAAVIDSYNEAKDTFYTEFDSNMNALKKSAAAVRNFDFSNVGEDPITKTAVLDKEGNEVTDKNGETVMKTTYSKGMQSALDAVTSLVDNYNDSLNFLKENSEVSGRVGRMASNFGDTTYRSSLYEQIGINVGKDGTLSIDEEKLANSIAENPDKVSRILGKDGLAGKAEQHVNTANSQRNNLFPSAKSMLGSQLDQAEIYTGKSMVNMSMISNIGNLVNMMF
ncbi:MAG: flagellar filament capping protein FliD [Selenomonadaceae bacterium]|nr:flagellar filament capping protein FliD [Selenomonadaceae bacterium]